MCLTCTSEIGGISGGCTLIPNEDSANGGSDESEFIFFSRRYVREIWGACGVVVRGLLCTHTTGGSNALQANQALHHFGVGKFLP
ncbi:hypothetical protein Y032_0646g1090 [Ancylostoma ceylanicum]|uniref:Uncharacterized protein n=1 Tax=Ancylostoma ceylanicum TaxID=53326 RepID=A0A016WKX3_9BILA|nr:hypothetical protein Y032_0646g1090 [Ancylostoma ceylanicum]